MEQYKYFGATLALKGIFEAQQEEIERTAMNPADHSAYDCGYCRMEMKEAFRDYLAGTDAFFTGLHASLAPSAEPECLA